MTVIKDRTSPAAAAVKKVELDQGPHRGKLAAAAGSRLGSEAETDTESGASSTEEGESPRSVAMWRGRKAAAAGCLHSQVLRVMEEDLHLGEDTVTSGTSGGASRLDHHIVILSRPILPCSPLGKKGSTDKSVR